MIRSSNESVKVGLNFCKTQVGGRMENIVSKVWANWTCKKYKCSIIYLTETSHEKYIEKCWKNVIVNNGKSKKTMFRSETSPADHMATVKAQRRRSVKWKLKAEIKTGCVHVKHCVHCNLWKHEAHTETRVQTEENSWTRRWNTICLFSSYTAAEKRQNDLWVQINNVDVMCHNMPDVGLVLCRALFWRCVKIPTCSTEWSSDQILLELHMKGFLCSLAPEAGGKQLDTHFEWWQQRWRMWSLKVQPRSTHWMFAFLLTCFMTRVSLSSLRENMGKPNSSYERPFPRGFHTVVLQLAKLGSYVSVYRPERIL